MIVDTATLATAAGYSPRHICRLAEQGVITAVGRPRTGRRGRPSMWFDLDAAMRVLDKRSNAGRK